MLAGMGGQWQISGHNGRGRPRDTPDQEDRLIVRSAITALDSSLSTIRQCIFNLSSEVNLVGVLRPRSARLHSTSSRTSHGWCERIEYHSIRQLVPPNIDRWYQDSANVRS
ncbi:hypothetical protein TNCV_1863031 [Trichonephila clavipes]|nr:hypothetical protein TNCV_1863031 [Trichonephila clavipes]